MNEQSLDLTMMEMRRDKYLALGQNRGVMWVSDDSKRVRLWRQVFRAYA